ncbi:YmiA family putative membrane protein [Kluyvera georgiana]
MISNIDCERHVMASENKEPGVKRKAWLSVFLGSALFWVAVALLIWKFWG